MRCDLTNHIPILRMSMRSGHNNMDWSKSTIPIPYIFSDMENLVYELSEVFLPGEQAPFQLATLKQAFT